ncbi:MAG: N-6 DNA methylase [Bellilinea sp.]
MVEVIDPQSGETVYDPACGSGGFLAAAFDHIRSHNSKRTVEQDVFYRREHSTAMKKSCASFAGDDEPGAARCDRPQAAPAQHAGRADEDHANGAL